jgi:hypothetical protein
LKNNRPDTYHVCFNSAHADAKSIRLPLPSVAHGFPRTLLTSQQQTRSNEMHYSFLKSLKKTFLLSLTLLYMFRATLCPSSGAFHFVLHSQPPVPCVAALVACTC